MKLKTRIKLAWLEMTGATLLLIGAVAVEITRPHAGLNGLGVAIGLLLPVFLCAPLCINAWQRLRKTQAQLIELGANAAPSADLWTAPGTLGVIGMMVLVAAVAAALVPALLYA